MTQPFLWLHIKKAGGHSMRQVLKEVYVETNRKRACPFIMLPKSEWNDNLNNHRISLGGYDYRRMLFAKKFLYPDEFDRIYKFTVVRNPYSRAVSNWKYLTPKLPKTPDNLWMRYSFKHFLESLPTIWQNLANNRALATHTAPVWQDITEEDGTCLVDYIARLETIDQDIQVIAKHIGITIENFPHRHVNQSDDNYRQFYNQETQSLVERYYADDIMQLGYEF